jgi:hypothetical protein
VDVYLDQETGGTPEAWLAELESRAERAWGPARRAELGPVLEAAAAALCRLARAPLDPLQEEPDFIGGARSDAGGA